MGVPKFYRWISERYPTLSEVISDSQIPEFDNLYLDMNGIIHQCSHPNDDDVTFRITEEAIFQDIFDYIEKLFMIVRPNKVFFMAVDGVAPRAKMNQQRARRFMSARTAQEQMEKAIKKGEELPDEKRFDSNCITPGTPFMTRLHAQLNAFVSRKITTDPKWQGKRIVVSGHNVPGEGEHKIMDFIRAERAGKDYDPNTRHCMYGLDADLMMLGICSHEPHFSLLREEVKFGRMPQKPHAKKGEKAVVKKDPKRCAPDQITFHLLHLSLMREYLYWEFHDLKDKLSFPYDQERIADDWILMCFLVGNDFIPHLPHVHIHDDGLPFLYDAYKRVLPTLDGYINESGWLNLKRFEAFLKAVADNDKDHFMKIIEDKSFLESKRTEGQQPSGSRPGLYDALDEQLEAFNDSDMSSCTDDEDEDHESDTESGDAAFVSSDEEDEIESTQKSSSETDIQSAADALASLDVEDPADSEFAREMALREFAPMDEKDFESSVAACWSRTIGNSFKRHKKEYYKEKLKYGNISKDQLRGQSEGYVRAIQWVLHYYYHGCVSWNWFFQHHYAPYISDVTDFSGMTMDFELSKPFHPFEQLLAVLPAASSDCLPPALRELMCDKNSPIADFYPMDFKTDLNGKKNDWEAVVLIPFIQESRLLKAIQSKEPMMTAEEKKRNEHGQHVLWTSETDKDGKAKPKPTLLSMDIYHIPKEKVVWGLLPNVKLDVYFPGFPTMKHLPHTGQLRCVNVSVFQQASKKHSMVLSIDERPDQQADLNTVATDLIGKEVCVEWPVLKIGMVDHVVSQTHRYSAEKDGSITVEELDPDQKKMAATKLRELKDRQMSRFAIDCNSSQAIVYVRRFLGVNYEAVDGTLIPRKQYGGVEDAMAVPINLVVTNITVEQGRRLQEIPVEQAYPPNSRVFVMAPSVQAFGYPCLVDAIEDPNKASCRVRIKCALTAQPDLTPIRNDIQAHSLRWYDGYGACKQVNISNRLMGRITGTIFLVEGKSGNHDTPHHHHGVKYNIGLNLKLTKKNLEVPDFSRRTKSGIWQYSLLAVNCLADYKKRFPEIFKCLEQSTSYDDIYYSGDIWENEDRHERRLTELRDYLAALPSAQIEKQDAGSTTADCMLLSHLEMLLQNTKAKTTMFKGSVTPNLIWRPDLYDGKVRPDPEADFQLLDRVVNTAHGQVPFGQLGTVISVMADKIEVLFDKEFQGGYKKKDLASCARVPIASLINITFGKERKGKPKMEMEERPSTSRAPGRLAAGRDAPRQSDWYKKGAKKEALYTEHPILKKLLAEPGSMKILSRNQEDGRTDTSSAPPKETKPVKMLIRRQETVEEKNKAVESRIHDMLGLNLDKKTMKKEKKKTEREEIEAAVKDIMKDVGNQPEEKKKEPLPGKWDPKKDNKSHPKETVFTNSSVKAVQLEPTVITASTPNVMPVKTVLPTRAAVSAAGPATTTLIPTSNVDRMHLTDLKPSTILKRGGPVNNRCGGRHPGGRGVPPPQKTPQPVPMPITQPVSSSTSSSSTGNGRKQKKCRLAATFPTS